MCIVERVRNVEDRRIDTKRQQSHHDTASTITPRHHNIQINVNQASKIRR